VVYGIDVGHADEDGNVTESVISGNQDPGSSWGEWFAENLFGDPAGDTIDIEMVDPDHSRMMRSLKADANPKNSIKYNMTLDGIELSMDLDGIEGLRLWDVFNSTGVPTNYYQNGLFRITGIKHSISGNDWKTSISSQYAPNSAESMSE